MFANAIRCINYPRRSYIGTRRWCRGSTVSIAEILIVELVRSQITVRTLPIRRNSLLEFHLNERTRLAAALCKSV